MVCKANCESTDVEDPQMIRKSNFLPGGLVHKKKSGHIKNLPLDILLDIISRLPVESVSECKLVCKGWLKLLHGRSCFTNMHVSRQLNQLYGAAAAHGEKLDTGLLFGCVINASCDVLLFCGGLYNDKIDTNNRYAFKKTLKKVRHPPMQVRMSRDYMVGSCNGLVCLARCHHRCVDPIYVYNLVTCEYVNLPKLIIPKESRRFPPIARGFGYVPSTDEYKVVRIYYPERRAVGQVQVYTLGSGCGWRTKCAPFPWVNVEFPASFADGSLYWLIDLEIYAFHLANEEMRMIPSPPPCHTPCFGSLGDDNFGLVVLRGNLCFFHQTLNAPHMEIWSLKKTDVEESWCKDFSIVYEKKERGHVRSFWPILITKNNEIIFMYEYESLSCYDPETTTWKEIVAYDRDFYLNCIWVNSHVNTFASLKTLGEKSNQRNYRRKKTSQYNSIHEL